METSPWHAGELQAQALSGADHIPGGGGIRSFMPDQHRHFFASLPFMVAATLDEAGAPMATLLTGRPGFVSSPDPTTLAIAAHSADPAGQRLVAGAPLGLLGIQPDTRRRNRANGVVTAADADGLTVQVRQSFGNCPQYIHPRHVVADRRVAIDAEPFQGLDARARKQIAAADTFFVATSSGEGVENGGVDISHRGGPPGFVRIAGDVLTIPDYRGNRYFNTLGNLLLEPRAALLFVDFANGELLQLQGTAGVAWGEHDLPGAERTWRFTVTGGWRGPAGLYA
ncbi:MAG: pyridoxamine 5'-phosphate oxidase family protein [Alphaproteobacteria bacterium]|nr:pyridoxamine 5'-phosphate oxidase family protein [Alphaproteobacteria bacterium]MBU1515334.1 pyridoxamine 5'-phosphate oxidase family protein [Alphaproteobacteria bacterium]MBU2095384.1 pyridoxamine 5'-phosphate oxidase family protein [Alphaproteobacteria bacterium]MBU2152596.1 pyridoxamine 5'-phosphate oxidase family protein [Alphaproteobacteria bacterium]MBU2309992.1 pyridoxamine 5'-phosphate oxidase family protein [Alphaproteobacteria bacterium]